MLVLAMDYMLKWDWHTYFINNSLSKVFYIFKKVDIYLVTGIK